jgi:D-alanine-D-alanine ligase
MNVTVLRGGPSNERQVSLVSGAAVVDGLRRAGHRVFESDIAPNDLSALDRPADVVFPVLHGAFGESGELQQAMEQRRLRFVGSGSAASRIGIDKVRTKQIWESVGLPTPVYEVLVRGVTETLSRVSVPCVVKPLAGGSSIDVRICRTALAAAAATSELLGRYERVLVERYIAGSELTVGILEDRALSPLRITTSHEFFDYQAKYVGNDAQHHFDLEVPLSVVQRVQELALRAHQAIGGRDLSRVDFMLDQEHRPYLLEINTMPGFTPKSLLPEMAAHEGIPFDQLVDRLVQRAKSRSAAVAA